MRKVSSKQSIKNRIVANIKKELSEWCACKGCNKRATDAAHLLPKSTFPEHYLNVQNIVGFCRRCHQRYDDNKTFRQQQKHLFSRAKQVDELGAIRYFDYD